jgi:hypothetical protein
LRKAVHGLVLGAKLRLDLEPGPVILEIVGVEDER